MTFEEALATLVDQTDHTKTHAISEALAETRIKQVLEAAIDEAKTADVPMQTLSTFLYIAALCMQATAQGGLPGETPAVTQ